MTPKSPGEETIDYTEYTLDMFVKSIGKDEAEIAQFNRWKRGIIDAHKYCFEVPHLEAQKPSVSIQRVSGEKYKLVNFASYNYLGYSYHPEVIRAAKEALDIYGLGATGSPILNGTFDLHNKLEQAIVKYFDQDGYGASIFSSGYGTNLGVLSSYIHKGDYIVLDRSAHASLIDGAILSQGTIMFFRHNDANHLDQVLKRVKNDKSRILVCTEGVYSADGDYCELKSIVEIAKKHKAKILVDEAHSFLLAGPNGRGVVEDQGVLSDVDMVVLTFSKSFGGVGGCLYAKQEMVNYVNYYARSRMFSCALDPAVTGGLIKVLELAGGQDGFEKRKRIIHNADYLRSKLQGKVDIGTSRSWVVPVIYGDERLTIPLSDYLQRHGLDVSLMMFPAVPKNKSRIRAFVTSEHTEDQLDQAAEALLQSANEFGFHL